MTTRVLSVSVPVADQDVALRFHTEVLGCEGRTDVEVWPSARLVEVVPPGSSVALVLVRMEGVPAMFSFADPDGNELVYTQVDERGETRGAQQGPDRRSEGAGA